MKNSKLLDLLKTFSKEDFRAFADFVRSPYYNKRTDLIALFDYLKKQAPVFADKKIERKRVYKIVYPHSPYNEKQIGYAMNYLHKLAEQFVGLRIYENNSLRKEADIIEGLVERRLDKHFQFLYKNHQKDLAETTTKSSQLDYRNYKAAAIANAHFLKQEVRASDASLQQAADSLDYFYIGEKLKLACEILDRQRIFPNKYHLHFEQPLREMCQAIDVKKNPVVAQYFEVFKMLTETDTTTHYHNLKRLFLKNDVRTKINDQQKILSYGINYCARQIRNSDNRNYFMEEALTLYIYGVEKQIMFSNGFLSPWHFKNVIKLGFNLKKYDWVEQFIRENNQYLEEQFRQNALHYNLADLYFQKSNFGEALLHLNQVEINEISYALGTREMLMRIYYETDEEEALISLIASFNIYLKRNKDLPSDVRKMYLNFCRIVGQILRRNAKKFDKIGEEIKNTKLLLAKNWLLEIYEKEKKHLIK